MRNKHKNRHLAAPACTWGDREWESACGVCVNLLAKNEKITLGWDNKMAHHYISLATSKLCVDIS